MVPHPLPRDHATFPLAATAILGLILAFMGVGAPPAANASYDPKSVEKSIVQLFIEWSGMVGIAGKDGQIVWATQPTVIGASCSGAFVSTSGHISTAGHCVDDTDTQEIGTRLAREFLRAAGVSANEIEAALPQTYYDEETLVRKVYAYQNGEVADAVLPPTGIVAEVIDFQQFERGDNALLRINNLNRETPALPVASVEPAVGDKITAVGFPGFVSQTSDAARQRASFKSGQVSSRQTDGNTGVAYLETDASTGAGMSGGPVLNENGEVVGSVSYGPSTESSAVGQDFNFATTGVRGFLVSHGVTLQDAAIPEPAPGIPWLSPAASPPAN